MIFHKFLAFPQDMAIMPALGYSGSVVFSHADTGRLAVEWVMVGLELGVALVIALAVYLTLKKK